MKQLPENYIFSKYAVHVESLRVNKHYLVVFDARSMADQCYVRLVMASSPDFQSDRDIWDWINEHMLILVEVKEREIIPYGTTDAAWTNENYGKTLILNPNSIIVPDLEL